MARPHSSRGPRCRRQGELTATDEPAQLAFELGVILAGTDIVAILHDDPGAVSRGEPPW